MKNRGNFIGLFATWTGISCRPWIYRMRGCIERCHHCTRTQLLGIVTKCRFINDIPVDTVPTLIVTILRHVSWRFHSCVLSLWPGVRSCSASCSHRVHENLLKRILSLPFYRAFPLLERTSHRSNLFENNFTIEKEILIDLSRRRKKERSVNKVANNEIRCHSMLVTLHESEGIFSTRAQHVENRLHRAS